MDVFDNGVLLCPCHASIFSLLQNVFLQCGEGLIHMARFLHRLYSSVCRKSCYILLACSWILGLGLGVLLFRYSGSGIVSLVGAAVIDRFSIVGLLSSLLLPFLFSALAVYISRPGLLYLICLAKAAAFGYLSCALFSAFPGCGWLVRLLFLFADQTGIILLFVYWQRHISGFRRFSMAGIGVYFAVILVAAGTDYCWIAPLLRKVIIL